jgi:hypothetical protein
MRPTDEDQGGPQAPRRTLDIAPSGPVRSATVANDPAPGSAAKSPPLATNIADAARETSGISVRRKALAFAIAAISDAISFGTLFAPPVQIVVDGVTAALLFWVLGFRWPLLPALAVEAVPGIAAFPTWTLAVGVLIGITPTKRAS